MTIIDPTKPLIDSEANNSKRTATPASWKPGQSGNPNGRPKKEWTFKDLILEVAEEELEVKDKEGNISKRGLFKKAIIKKLFIEAAKGNIGAIKELLNRVDGMPQQKLDIDAHGNWIVTMKRDNA